MNGRMDRRDFLVMSGAAAAWLASGGFAQPATRTDGLVLAWDELGDGVFVTSQQISGGAVLAAIGRGGALIVDSKFPAFAAAIAEDVSSVAGGSRGWVFVNTHHHGDHTSGNLALVPRARASYGHRNLVPRVESQLGSYRNMVGQAARQVLAEQNERLTLLAEDMADRVGDVRAEQFVPRETLGFGEAPTAIDVGGTAVELYSRGPGHTDNDVIVRLPGADVVHTGDLVFNGLHPFFDENGGVDPRGWIESLRVARGLCGAETKVVPGHGPVGGPEIIDAQIAYIEKLYEAVEREITAGATKEEAQAKRFDFFDGLGFERLAPTGIGVVYDELKRAEGQG